MNLNIKRRVLKESEYILKTKETVREIARIFKVSKSTVHKDLQERLKDINEDIYNEVNEILNYHTKIRHIRGGEATRIKYLNIGQK